MLRVGQWLIREACRRGEILSVRLGQRIIIPHQAIKDFLAAAPEGDESGAE